MKEKGDGSRGVLLFVRLGKQSRDGTANRKRGIVREESWKVETRAFVARQTLALSSLALTKAPQKLHSTKERESVMDIRHEWALITNYLMPTWLFCRRRELINQRPSVLLCCCCNTWRWPHNVEVPSASPERARRFQLPSDGGRKSFVEIYLIWLRTMGMNYWKLRGFTGLQQRENST